MSTVQKKFSGPHSTRGVLQKQTFLMQLRGVLCMVILILAFGTNKILGQGVGISEVSIIPDPSSILELRSSVRGFLAPRMTTSERMTLGGTSPATGLLVYDTDTKSFWYWDAAWKAFASGAWGTSNQLLGMNAAGDANEYKTLSGTMNQINVTHTPGLIVLSTPQNIHIGATPTFQGLIVNGLDPNSGVYTDGSRALTSIPPSSGTIGYWDRTGNILSPTNVGDHVTTSGNIYTTGTGTITSAGLLTGNAGATISGGPVNLNNNSNFPININTGTSTGPVTIGNSLNTITLPAFNTAGIVHNDATGLLSTSLIINNDITDGTIDLTTKVTNVLPVPNGGTGVAAITENYLIYGNGTDPVQLLPTDGTTGTLLMNTAGGPPGWSALDALPPTAGVLQSVNGGTGYSIYGDGQLLIGNSAGTLSRNPLTGTVNQVYVTNGDGTITLSTPQDIHTGAAPTFQGLTVSGLSPNTGVYTDGSSTLTSSPPNSGTIGYWNRNGNILSPTNDGDNVTTSGNIYTTGTGTITSEGLLTGNSGATISGGAINLNNDSNFPTYINTGASTGPVTIGNSLNTITLPAFNTAGVVHNDATGQLSTGLIVNGDITDGTIDLETKVTGILPIENGGTNSGTPLQNHRVMVSRNGQIVEAGTLSNGQIIVGKDNDDPQLVTMAGDITIDNAGITTIGAGVVENGMLTNDAVTTDKIANGTIINEDINASAAIDATKLIDGSVTNDELSYINTLTSNAQTQLNNFGTQIGDINTLADGRIYLGDINNIAQEVLMTGDVTINNAGATLISAGAVTTGKIQDETILNADIDPAAAIEFTKLENLTAANIILGSAANVPTATPVSGDATISNTGVVTVGRINGANLGTTTATNNNILVANGSQWNSVAMSQDATIDNTGVLALANTPVVPGTYGDGTHVARFTVDGKGRLTFAENTLITGISPVGSALTNGYIWIGDATGFASEALVSGDVTMTNTGVVTISNDAVTTGKILNETILNEDIADATINLTEKVTGVLPIANGGTNSGTALVNNRLMISRAGQIVELFGLNDGQMIMGSTGSEPQVVTMSGDITIDNSGVTTIGAGTVENGMLVDDAITNTKLADNSVNTSELTDGSVTTVKISDGTIVNADIDANAQIDASKLIDGSVSSAELGYINTLASNAQTQLDNIGTQLGGITSLADGRIYLGDNTNTAQEVLMSGDVTIDNLGATTISAGAVTTGKIQDGTILNNDIADGTIDLTSKVTNILPIANGGTNSSTALVNNRLMISRAGQIVELFGLNDGQMIMGSTGSEPQVVTMSGDITIDNSGVTTIGTGTVENGMLVDDAVTNTKLADNSVNTSELTDGSVTTVKISDGTIVNADIDANAQIDASKLIDGSVSSAELGYINTLASNAQTQLDNIGTQLGGITSLADGRIYLGDNTNTAQEVLMSGDVTIDNLGATTISAGAVTTGKIQDGTILNNDIADGTIDLTSKVTNILPIANGGTNSGTALVNNRLMISRAGQIVELFGLNDGQMIMGSTGSEPQVVTMSGDITIDNSGVTTIGAGTVENGMLVDDAITNTKLADNSVNTSELTDGSVTTVKISDGTIVNADIADAAAIDATKLADGEVDNTEYDYLNGVTFPIQTQFSNVQTNLGSEVTRATAAEGVLTTSLAAEVTRATGAETTLTTNLNSEVTRATAAEGVLTTNLSAEVTRATAAESTLTANLAAEVTNRTNGDAALQTELNATQTGAGLDANGGYTANGATNYVSGATSLKVADNLLDAQVKLNTDAIASGSSNIGNLQIEVDNIETGSGLNADGTYTSNGAASYISTATSLKVAENLLDTQLKTTTDNLGSEVTRATTAEGVLTTSLAAEVTRATGAETTLTTNLNSEVTRATAAEGVLTTNLSAEVTRATAAESTLTANLAAEVTNRTNGDAALQTELNATQTGAGLDANGGYTANGATNYVSGATSLKVADNLLDAQVKLNTDAIASGSSNIGNLQIEVDNIETGSGLNADGTYTSNGAASYISTATSLKVAENLLDTQLKTTTDNLGSEVTRATTAEGVLTTNLAAEVTRATGAETTLTTNLNSEVTRATAAEGVLTTNLSAEVTRATAAESTLTANLATEVTNRTNGDAALQTELDATQTGAGLDANGGYTANGAANYISGATSLKVADNLLDTQLKTTTDNLGSEVTRATAAEGVLTTNLAAEVTRATGAETTLTTNLNSEVTRATAAEGVLTTNLSAEVTRATAAESTLTANLATEVTNRTNGDAALQTELDATQTGAGLDANGGYTANGAANYVSGATSLKVADNLLDARVKVNSDNIDLKANISGQIFTGAISATNLSGTNTGDQTLAGLGGVPDTRTVNGKSLATDITLLLASTDFANQGTSTTVLHGNAGGAPTFSAVNLTSDVTGVLPIARGGTNNGSLPVTNGGVIYTDGSKLENTGLGLPGEVFTSHGAGAPTWENQSTGFTGNSRGTIAAGLTRYAPITGTITPVIAQTTAYTRNIVWRSGTIKNLYVRVSGNPGFANSILTILLNGVATSLNVTLNGATSGQDLSDSFTVSAGDEIGVRIVTAGGANTVYWSWAVEFSY